MKVSHNYMFRSLVVLVALLFLSITRIWAEQSQSEQTIKTFFNDIITIKVNKMTIKSGIFCSSIGLPYRMISVNDGAYNIRISLDGTTIYFFNQKGWSSSETDIVEGKGHADAISETNAFTFAIPLLNYLGFPTQKDDYKIVFCDNAYKTTSSVEDLWGASWLISKDLYSNGKRCRGRYLTVIISAASGKIVSFIHKPVIHPQNTMNVQVTYASAQQAALAWLTAAPYFTGKSPTINTSNTQGEVVIAQKEGSSQENTLCEDAISTYYCWEVNFDFIENEKSNPGKIWVNVETGEVIGDY